MGRCAKRRKRVNPGAGGGWKDSYIVRRVYLGSGFQNLYLLDLVVFLGQMLLLSFVKAFLNSLSLGSSKHRSQPPGLLLNIQQKVVCVIV